MITKSRINVWLLSALLAACGGISNLREAPRVSLVSIKPVDFQLFEQRYRVTLRVQNPNESDIAIRGLDYEIDINEKLFARGVSGKPIKVPAYGEALAEVEVVSSLARLFEQINELSERGESDLRYSIKGHVSIDGVPGAIPFEYENTLELPKFRPVDKRRTSPAPI